MGTVQSSTGVPLGTSRTASGISLADAGERRRTPSPVMLRGIGIELGDQVVHAAAGVGRHALTPHTQGDWSDHTSSVASPDTASTIRRAVASGRAITSATSVATTKKAIGPQTSTSSKP